jgi:hypothetical protein
MPGALRVSNFCRRARRNPALSQNRNHQRSGFVQLPKRWIVERTTARLEGHYRPVTELCVLPDGRFASSSWEKTIRLWDTTTGTETARLEGTTPNGSRCCACCPTAASPPVPPTAPMTIQSGCGTRPQAPETADICEAEQLRPHRRRGVDAGRGLFCQRQALVGPAP